MSVMTACTDLIGRRPSPRNLTTCRAMRRAAAPGAVLVLGALRAVHEGPPLEAGAVEPAGAGAVLAGWTSAGGNVPALRSLIA